MAKNGIVPERFNQKVGRADGDGWALKEKGNTITGRLIGRFEFNSANGRRAFYQIELQGPCKATTKNEADDTKYDTITLKAGQIVNLDEVSRLEDLRDKCEDGGIYDVWLQFGEKKKSKGSQNTPWNFVGPYVAVVKAPSRRREEAPF